MGFVPSGRSLVPHNEVPSVAVPRSISSVSPEILSEILPHTPETPDDAVVAAVVAPPTPVADVPTATAVDKHQTDLEQSTAVAIVAPVGSTAEAKIEHKSTDTPSSTQGHFIEASAEPTTESLHTRPHHSTEQDVARTMR
jgi:hypothetical protein